MGTTYRMDKVKILTPEFVDAIPANIEQGKIYISMEFATAVHSCCCGCGMEVVTPFSPTDWKLIFDGVSVSLSPSIGNWSFPCRSHYWVTNNQIRWSGDWSQDQVDAGRAHDIFNKQQKFGETERNSNSATPRSQQRFWSRLLNWFHK